MRFILFYFLEGLGLYLHALGKSNTTLIAPVVEGYVAVRPSSRFPISEPERPRATGGARRAPRPRSTAPSVVHVDRG